MGLPFDLFLFSSVAEQNVTGEWVDNGFFVLFLFFYFFILRQDKVKEGDVTSH